MSSALSKFLQFLSAHVATATAPAAMLAGISFLMLAQTHAAAQGNLIDIIINGSRILDGSQRRGMEPYTYRSELQASNDLTQTAETEAAMVADLCDHVWRPVTYSSRDTEQTQIEARAANAARAAYCQ